ncbi:hypothetical protein ACFQH1_02030 [Lactiplantibacillus daoliensis]|uniref:Uncharacterized protein n=1 Tax=Lactiplantibacillus daoliensis TaxID=2559916 RepID=A0ABW1UGA2_9LACO|nr:hypothetical protein [Lactiplantibacillus daoliensis]
MKKNFIERMIEQEENNPIDFSHWTKEQLIQGADKAMTMSNRIGMYRRAKELGLPMLNPETEDFADNPANLKDPK